LPTCRDLEVDPVFAVGSYTSYSSSDAFRPYPGKDGAFEWNLPREGVVADSSRRWIKISMLSSIPTRRSPASDVRISSAASAASRATSRHYRHQRRSAAPVVDRVDPRAESMSMCLFRWSKYSKHFVQNYRRNITVTVSAILFALILTSTPQSPTRYPCLRGKSAPGLFSLRAERAVSRKLGIPLFNAYIKPFMTWAGLCLSCA